VYNAETGCFEEQVEIDCPTCLGSPEINCFSTVGNNVFSGYTIPWRTEVEHSLLVTIDGVKQDDAALSISANVDSTWVKFVTTPSGGAKVEITGFQTYNATDMKLVAFAGNGSTTTLLSMILHTHQVAQLI
jgi:hypothetical protein